MSREFQPIGDCLQGLKELVRSGATGSYYLATPDGSIAAITLNGGSVEALNFKGRRGDFAVELLKSVETASCTFRAEAPRAARHSQLSSYAIRWLVGEPTVATVAKSAGGGAAPHSNDDLQQYRRTVESIAFAFLGPIAAAVCEGAFCDCMTLQDVVEELAADMPPNEADQFRAEIAKATGIR